uniref:Uncharacterized protein n=1 Tax=Pelagomonas calceolata TaxID=35677 RepID=A0A7S3ZMG2_9STRA
MPTELKSAPAVNPLKTKYLFSAGAPYGTSEGTERFPEKTLEFTNAAAGETFHSSCAARERNRRAATVPRPPYRVADTAAQRWDRAASEVPYDEATLRQSYVRTGARATFSRGLHHNLGPGRGTSTRPTSRRAARRATRSRSSCTTRRAPSRRAASRSRSRVGTDPRPARATATTGRSRCPNVRAS